MCKLPNLYFIFHPTNSQFSHFPYIVQAYEKKQSVKIINSYLKEKY